MLAGGQCGVRCGPGYFRQNSSHCSPCHPSCHSCVGPGDTDCALCEAPSLYFSRRCVPYCPAGYTASADSAECLACPLGCDSCARPDRCLSCSPGWTAQDNSGLCSPPPPQLCQPGLYRGGGTCLACHSACRTCSGHGEEDCTGCYSDHKQFRSTCSAACPPGESSPPLHSLPFISCCQAPSYPARETPVSAARTPAGPVTAGAATPASPDISCR